MPSFPSVAAMLTSLNPIAPVYCVHPLKLAEAARTFLEGFPGTVLYAIKANNNATVIDSLYAAGIRHFDCASLAEVELVKSRCPDSSCYLMTPVRLPGDAATAFRDCGVRHFMVDCLAGLPDLISEISSGECVVFARMAVSHESAVENLSSKFGAAPADIPAILDAIRSTGAEPALAFNVGSGVRRPEAYEYALGIAARVLAELPFPVRLIDIGGGFPHSYPGFETPPLGDYFSAIRRCGRMLPAASDREFLAEPGRALCAGGLSTVVRVLLRNRDRLYINDGMYGAFWELRFDGHKQHPVTVYRQGRQWRGTPRPFTVFGPTCDATDRLPEPIDLPGDIAVGDHIEFGATGAYSLSGRTDFNGFYSSDIITIGS
jgi:ornithine decarboxylase